MRRIPAAFPGIGKGENSFSKCPTVMRSLLCLLLFGSLTELAAQDWQISRVRLRNVKDFGAKGDGVANDTAAIQRALANYDCLFFPSGIYNVRRRLCM